MKAGIYYRVSTDMQDFASQQHEVESWIAALPEAKKPVLVRVFSDQMSGKRETEKNRVGFQALKKAVESGEIDTVIVYKIDRLSRDKLTLMYVLMDWIKMGRNFVSVSQPVFQMGSENPFRLTMLALFAELAHMERDTLISRVKAGMNAAKARGVKFGRDPWVMSPELRERALELRSRGLPIRDIAEMLEVSKTTVGKIVRGVPLDA